MTNSKNTKRALLASILSLMLCLTMLIGSTFAWFTDSVTSGKNKIVAGNLDIELEYCLDPSAEGAEWKSVQDATDLFGDITLWEPGTTGVVYFRLSNLGTLALKYKLGMSFTDTVIGTSVMGNEIKLSEILEFGIVAGQETTFASRQEAIDAVTDAKNVNEGYSVEQSMGVTDEKTHFALVVYMPITTSNEANYKTGTAAPQIDLGVTLLATQDTVEQDGFGNDYDADAWNALKKEERLKALQEEGYTAVTEAASLKTLTESSTDEPAKLVLADNLQTDVKVGTAPSQNVQIVGAAVIDFNGNQVERKTNNGNGLLVQSPDADVTLRNADFVSVKGGNVLRVEKANSLTIEDSNFICQAAGSTGNKLIQVVAYQEDKPMTVVFKNCTFDKGFIEFVGNALNYVVQFDNCKFVWNDKNGSSFVQLGYYTPGTYTFNDCEFEFNNWWSGGVLRANSSDKASIINLNNVTVTGQGDRKPKVVDGSIVAKRQLTVNCSGTNTYTFGGETLAWDNYYFIPAV